MGNFNFRFSRVTQSIKLLDYILQADLGGVRKKCDQDLCPLEFREEILPGNNLASDFAKCLAWLSVSWEHLTSHGSWSWM